MEIKIREFYPLVVGDGRISGTMRVLVENLGLELLGVFITKNKNGWIVQLPQQRSLHHVTGDPVRFPILSFVDTIKQNALVGAIRKQAPAFIEAWIKAKGPGYVFKQKKTDLTKTIPTKEKQQQQEKAQPALANATEGKQMVSSALSGEWRDPPKKKTTKRR